MLLLGLGIGLALPSIMNSAMSGARYDEVGVISGVANSTGKIGGALPVAAVASITGSVSAALIAGGASTRQIMTSYVTTTSTWRGRRHDRPFGHQAHAHDR
jgi:hypothetical protein